MRKNLWVKIVASIWLLGIIISVIWTWILALMSWNSTDNVEQNTELTEEQLRDLIKNYSTWATSSWITK
jgi:hypothetical protein